MRRQTTAGIFQRKQWEKSYGKIPDKWSFVPLGSLFNERKEKSSDQEKYPLYSFTIENSVTPKTDRYERSFLLKDNKKNKFCLVYDADFVLNPMNLRFGAIGMSRVKFPVLVSAYYNILIPNKEKIDFLYIENFLKSSRMIDLYDKIAIGSLVEKRRVHLSIFNTTYIPLPPLKEQIYIGSVIEKFNHSVNLTERLIAAKQEFRKGLMQLLLTGKRRFSEFVKSPFYRKTRYEKIPKDWEYPYIGEIAHHVSVKNKGNGALPVLSCTKHQGLVDSLSYFGKQVFSKNLGTYKIVKRGQFAYATNHIEEGSIGYQNLYDKALISPMYTVFETGKRVDDRFLFLIVKTELYRHIFESMTSSSVNRRGSLRWKDFSKIRIPLPSIEEQAVIVKAFETLERETKLLEQMHDFFKKQKKGLMQKLLTGKIRVTVL